MRKITLSLSIVALLILLISSTAFAGTWSSWITWGATQANGSYSPDWGNTAMYEYVSSSGQLRVTPKAKFTFSSSKINGLRFYYNNYRYYWTFDLSVDNQYDNNVSAIWAYSTNTVPQHWSTSFRS